MISRVQTLGLGAWAAAFMLVAACGSNVIGATGSGTTGTGGIPSTGVGGAGDCNPGDPNIGECSGGVTTTGPGGFGAMDPGGGGGGYPCGGLSGSPCPGGQYCAFADQECGGNDSGGWCTLEPSTCPKTEQPTCGCDHMVYDNPCLAAQAGADVDALGGCTAPAGMFGCGSGFCSLASHYCMQVPAGTSVGQTSYTCEALPAACGSSPSCACLSQVQCGLVCQTTPDGGIEVTCETN